MGNSGSSKVELKLVHPGRHVEIHHEPISAAEILNKYPRHCIARPDVFQFPWIVVKPEAILFPGKVFYIVPKHTIYDLLKSKGYESRSLDERSNQYYNSNDYEHRHYYNDANSPRISKLHPEVLGSDTGQRRSSTPRHRAYRELDTEDNMDNSYMNRDGHEKLYPGSSIDWPFGSRRNGYLGVRSGHLELKSCLRKHGSRRKLLNLKVTFGSPTIIPTSPRESPTLEENARCYWFISDFDD